MTIRTHRKKMVQIYFFCDGKIRLVIEWPNDDIDGFTSLNSFLVTGYVNRYPIHYSKLLKSINLLRNSWSKGNRNKGW